LVSEAKAAPRLGLGVKLGYGLGSVANGSATTALGQGIIFYYLTQVLRLPPLTVGSLILVSLVVDAVVDPLIGRWSDTTRTRWGRRHPFMYASAIPVGLMMYFFWNPPPWLEGGAAVVFAFATLVTLRLCVSLYELPSTALTPELAPDYHERTDLLAFRWFFGVAGGVGMAALLYLVFERKDATHPGMLDPVGYGRFGAVGAVVTVTAILVSSLATHRYIPRFATPPRQSATAGRTFKEITGILTNPSLLVIIASGIIGGVAGGMDQSLNNYMALHFWGLSPQVIGVMYLLLSPISIIGVGLAPLLSRALGKKYTMIVVFLASIFGGTIPIVLRLVGYFPANGSPWVPVILMADLTLIAVLALIGFVIITSMIADVAEDVAVRTGVRAEGLLFATNGLLPKATAGIGGFIAGAMVSAVHFPRVIHGPVDPAIMRHLVMLSIPVKVALQLLGTSVLIFYRIDKSTHERNLEALGVAPSVGEAPIVTPGVPAPAIEPRPL
jgi:GPH family glycoside/pentoside/hexuronide:cation symporter